MGEDRNQAKDLGNLVSRYGVAWREVSGMPLPVVQEHEGAETGSVDEFKVMVLAGTEELKRAISIVQPDLLLMDTSIWTSEGAVQAACRFISQNYAMQVVLVGPPEDCRALGHVAHQVWFVAKPVDPEQLLVALQGAVQELFMIQDRQQRARPLCLRHAGTVYLVEPDDIFYAESRGRTLSIHVRGEGSSSGEVVSVTMTLEHFKRLLPDTFVQCHKSFLVNLAQVVRFSDDVITLRNGSVVPVSQRKRPHVLRQIFSYGRYVSS